jgi:hypothetical protein
MSISPQKEIMNRFLSSYCTVATVLIVCNEIPLWYLYTYLTKLSS